MKWNVATGDASCFFLHLRTAGRDSVFVCIWDRLTHYNLVTGEERCTVRLDSVHWEMKTVLYYNQRCIALSCRW